MEINKNNTIFNNSILNLYNDLYKNTTNLQNEVKLEPNSLNYTVL